MRSAVRLALWPATCRAFDRRQTHRASWRPGWACLLKSLQGLQLAAQMAGVSELTPVLQKMSITLGQAASGAKPAMEALAGIGLSIDDLAGMSPDEQFKAIAAAINAIPDPAARAAAAVRIFGEQGVALLPLMAQNLEEVQARMERLGAVLSADQTEAIEGMNDALTMVQATFEGIIGQVVGNLAPVVTALAEEFLAFVESFNSVSGEGGTGIANAITDAMFDILDYLAQVFDSAVAGFEGFGVTMADVGAVFDFVGNIFVAVAETLRAAFNAFELIGNALAIALGAFLEGLGSWVSSDLEQFGKDLKQNAMEAAGNNFQQMTEAGSNAADAAGRAIFGGDASSNADGPASRALRAARERNTPEAKAERDAPASVKTPKTPQMQGRQGCCKMKRQACRKGCSGPREGRRQGWRHRRHRRRAS
jgi:hypothetical protein